MVRVGLSGGGEDRALTPSPDQESVGRFPGAWTRLSPATRHLAAFFVLNAIAMNVLLLRFAGRGGARSRGLTTVSQLRAVLSGQLGTDSWMPMREAFEQFRVAPGVPLYHEVFFTRRVKFQYPPASLFLPSALDAVGVGAWVLNAISVVAMVATAGLAVLLLHRAAEAFRDVGHGPASWLDRIVSAIVALGLALSFYPLVRGVANGQIQPWVTALLAAVIWSWLRRHERLAGVLAGITCQLKPQYALLLPWAVARRRWGFALGFVLTSVILGVPAIVAFGWENHFGYLTVLEFMARHGEAYFPNQSVNGLLNRMLFNGNNLRWSADSFAPFNAWVYAGTSITSALLVASALFWRRDEHGPAGTIDLMIALLTFTIASPIAWEHHYGVLLPIYAVALPALLRWPVLGRATLPALAVSYALASNYFGHIAVLTAGGPFNFVQSYLLFAAALLLFLLYRLRHAIARVAGAPAGMGAHAVVDEPRRGFSWPRRAYRSPCG